MAAKDRPADGTTDALARLGQTLDTVAGAVASIAASHNDLAERLDAIERQVLARPAAAIPPPPGAPGDLAALQTDLALTLARLTEVSESIERLDSRTEDRLAAVRDAAAAPVADLQALLSARNARQDAQLSGLTVAVDNLAADGPASVRERLAELTGGMRELVTPPPGEGGAGVLERIEELGGELAAVREQVERIDVVGPMEQVTQDLTGRLTRHTDTALAGMLRIIDDRLTALRAAVTDAAGAAPAQGGFEAGAVMGATQAAWNRLEQRLDSEFDDLGRQLQSMAALMDQAVASSEVAANRPVVTGDQLRKAASAVRDTVVSASRSRRDRRGGPKGLGSGS